MCICFFILRYCRNKLLRSTFCEGGSAWNSNAKADPRADVSVLASFVPEGSRDPGRILARLANPPKGPSFEEIENARGCTGAPS